MSNPLSTTREETPGERGNHPTPVRLWKVLAITSATGLIASLTLLIEKINLIADPNYVPTCSIDPILSCGSVMESSQSEAFGFPNPIIGVVGFTVVFTAAMALAAGGRFRRWFWIGLQLGATFGVVFVHWLIFQSLYRIGALCPYCMVVWAVTIPIFLYITLQNLNNANLPPPRSLQPLVGKVTEYHGVVLTSWYLIITALIAQRFWDHWVTLIP